jgi:hypothetical protein
MRFDGPACHAGRLALSEAERFTNDYPGRWFANRPASDSARRNATPIESASACCR